MGSNQHDCPHTSEVPHSREARPKYSASQIERYIQRIQLPDPHRSSPVLQDWRLALSEDHALPLLSALMRYHMAHIPFENLTLHYSHSRAMTLDVHELFASMVDSERGRGGYCFQQNIFFATILHSLGYEIMTTAARINSACEPRARDPNFKGPDYNPWNHMIIIATISSKDYLIDVGNHAWGPVVPIELQVGEVLSLSPRTIRLVRGCIPEHVSRRDSNQMWHFEVSNGQGEPWVPTYSFAMIEFLPVDFEVLNWWVSTSKKSWFTRTIICGKLLLSPDGSKLIGDLTLFGSMMRKRINGKVELERECKSDDERCQLLSDYFGIKVTSSEQSAILMTGAQIP